MRGEPPALPARELQAASLLAEAGRLDTVFRDVYLRRARDRLAHAFPRHEHASLKGAQDHIQRTLRDARDAVEASDWMRVVELAEQARRLRQRLSERQPERAVADEVYEGPEVRLDPFFPSFAGLVGASHDPVALLERARKTLAALAAHDPAVRGFYDGRLRYFERLAIALSGDAASADPLHTTEIQTEALHAAEKGQIERLQRLARTMLAATEHRSDHLRAPAGSSDLAQPFTAPVAERARALGLGHALLEPLPEIAEGFQRHAWRPRDGTSDEAAHATDFRSIVDAPDLRDLDLPLRELIAQQAIHPYVNSGGARYLPRLVAERTLVEDFPEGPAADAHPAPEGGLLRALGLERRHGLSRSEIEGALLEHGSPILERELDLDPLQHRIVCIPHDVYERFGAPLGWGRREMWTHFDGYEVMRSGELRALVGGNVRYGGPLDRISIPRDDRRPNVIVRFAIVRRERLLARWT